MAYIFIVLSSTAKMTLEDQMNGKLDVRYLTLSDNNKNSENRYYVSLTGKDAQIEWHEGDCIMVELSFLAYQQGGQWHVSNRSGSIDLIEVGRVTNNLKSRDNG